MAIQVPDAGPRTVSPTVVALPPVPEETVLEPVEAGRPPPNFAASGRRIGRCIYRSRFGGSAGTAVSSASIALPRAAKGVVTHYRVGRSTSGITAATAASITGSSGRVIGRSLPASATRAARRAGPVCSTGWFSGRTPSVTGARRLVGGVTEGPITLTATGGGGRGVEGILGPAYPSTVWGAPLIRPGRASAIYAAKSNRKTPPGEAGTTGRVPPIRGGRARPVTTATAATVVSCGAAAGSTATKGAAPAAFRRVTEGRPRGISSVCRSAAGFRGHVAGIFGRGRARKGGGFAAVSSSYLGCRRGSASVSVSMIFSIDRGMVGY